MPIEVNSPIKVFDQEEFHALDRKVMGVVFSIHNEFGRLLDEKLFKCEIAARCITIGLQPVEREVRVCVSHDNFVKDYLMDLLICSGFMMEAKTAERLVGMHRSQALNYLLLTGMKHGRLVNLRAERVEHNFVSTTLTQEERRQFTIAESEWLDINTESRLLKAKTVELLADWGGFLDVNLYREALIHFLGGPGIVCKAVEVFSGSRPLGTQQMNLLNEDTAFAVTTKHDGLGTMRDHLSRLLHHTKLNNIQWVNLNRHLVEFSTLSKTR
jgi:GxxExxY protein